MMFANHTKSNTQINKSSKRFLLRLFVVGATAAVLPFTPVFSSVLLAGLTALPLPKPDPQPQHTATGSSPAAPNTAAHEQAYVVLGGGLTQTAEGEVVLNHFSTARVQQAQLSYQILAMPIVVSGIEAPWMAQWLHQQGIDGVVAETASRNTCENARFVAKRYPIHVAFLITDPYHMPRARRQFALVGISTHGVFAHLVRKKSWWSPSNNLVHSRRAVYEAVAYARDVFRPQSDCRAADTVSLEEMSQPQTEAVRVF